MRYGMVVAVLLLSMAHASWPQTNLLTNPGFESGQAAPWAGLSAGDIAAAGARTGAYGARITSAKTASVSGIAVTPGRTYALLGWVRKDRFAGTQWGYFRIRIGDGAIEDESINSRAMSFPDGEWVKTAIAFVPTRSTVQIEFGCFGPQDTIDLCFDDFVFIENPSNAAPYLDPQASSTTVSAGAAVDFTANADDPDGAIRIYRWEFGDGAEARTAACSHAWSRPGAYTVRLTAWDNAGASSSDSLTITVSSAGAPAVAILSPSPAAAFSTAATQVRLEGSASADAGRQVVRVVWDHIRAGRADTVALIAGQSVSWDAGNLDLAPGTNEILVSAYDDAGRVNTDNIVITRTVSAPAISNIQPGAASVQVHGKYEVSFEVATVSQYPLFGWDNNPPAGVPPGAGVTVEAVIQTPTGAEHQPAFWYQRSQVDQTGATGEPSHFAEPDPSGRWVVRYSPRQAGAHQVSLSVRDASGTATASAGSFTATAPSGHGFIRVSPDDPRYFEFSDRTFHFPIGPAAGWTGSTPGAGGANYARPWMGGTGIYSTNWSRWKSTAEQWGNEGAMTPLSYAVHYPSHDLSYRIFHPQGRRIWITSWCDDRFYHRFKPNTDYLVVIRLRTDNITGPVNGSYPWGFMIKTHAWPGDSVERDLRADPSIIPVINTTRDWHTVVARYRHTSTQRNDISLYLDNVTAGEVHIDQLSIREILPGTALGGELIRNSRADQHTYVEQRPAAWFDWQVSSGEQTGVAFQYVVQDKNDWIPNHLSSAGVFDEDGAGYYAADNTRTRWLQKQWWRYCASRWGYSTAVRAWELCNEGPPADPASPHAQTAQSFGAYLHAVDAHPHLTSTSFWAGWRPAFWGSTAYGDVSYADRHAYTEGDSLGYDLASWYELLAGEMYPDRVGKPIIIAETGVSQSFGPIAALAADNDGTWFHNLLWAQLSHTGVSCPNYWFSEHLERIPVDTIAARFSRFMLALDLNRGGYVPLDATVSNPRIRVSGQKNPATGKAHLWVHNRTHTWAAVMGVAGKGPVIPQSGTVGITLAPNADYPVQWYNTWTGTIDSSRTVRSDGTGLITFVVSALADDVAVAVSTDLSAPVARAAHAVPSLRPAIRGVVQMPGGAAVVRYYLPAPGPVEILLFDPAGRRVSSFRDQHRGPGQGQAVLERVAASGVYIVRLRASGHTLYGGFRMLD